MNESRVSQLHARAVQRLKKALGTDSAVDDAAQVMRPPVVSFEQTMKRLKMAKSTLPAAAASRNAWRGAALHGTRREGDDSSRADSAEGGAAR